VEERKRKTRSDKKTGINPIVTTALYDHLCRLAYVCDRPLKDVGERLVYLGLYNRQVINDLSRLFRRPYWFSDFVMLEGDQEREGVQWQIGQDQHRIGLRFPKDQYEKLKQLAYSLDTSLTKATAILIQVSMHNQDSMINLLSWYVQGQLDQARMKQLEQVIFQINRKSTYKEKEISMGELLAFLFSKMGDRTKKISEMVTDWMDELTSRR
jgi:hypothetical protein